MTMKPTSIYLLLSLLTLSLDGCRHHKSLDDENLTDSERLEVLDFRIEKHPKDAEAYAERAAVLMNLGRAKEASYDAARAVELDPDNVTYRLRQADVCFANGNVEDSYKALDEMVAHVESIVNKLGLKYRILRLCGGDMSFTSAITYDFELWSAAQGRWLEISSVSNFETYQANRLHLRYRDADGKTQLAHTLNGSSLALPRVVAALLEDNQTPDGIIIPEVLRPYTGFDKID